VRAVLDTNVVISGIFFGGIPGEVLDAWADNQFELVLTPSILDEYLRTCDRLGASHPDLEYREVLAAIAGHATLVADNETDEAITADPADDKFMVCGQLADALVISGDAHLLNASGWCGVIVITPRDFIRRLGASEAT
jgi:putative PIN family toxin of toxin-antitoxin system